MIEKKELDLQRTQRTIVFGATFISLNLYLWYAKTLPIVLTKIPPNTIFTKNVPLTMTFIDQLFFAPYICSNYLFGSNFVQFQDPMKAGENVKKKLGGVLKANYCYWPIVNFLNFRFVPMHYRILIVNFCAIAWNSFMAFRNAR